VTATDLGDVTVILADGTKVVWGTGEASAAKAAALNGILQQIGVGALDPATTIDVSTPSAVVVR
jgi:cell division protein FtsQ